MDILDLRQFSSERLIRAVPEKRLMTDKRLIVKLMKANDRFYLTTFSGKNKVALGLEDTDRRYVEQILGENTPFIAGIVSTEQGKIIIRIVCYAEDGSGDTSCIVSEDFEKLLKKSVDLSDVHDIYSSLEKLSSIAVSPLEQRYVIGVRISNQTQEDTPDMILVCSERAGYIHLYKKNVRGVNVLFCTDISRKPPSGSFRYMLMGGRLRFIPQGSDIDPSSSINTALEKVNNDSRSFFRIWELYGRYEFGEELKNLVQVGVLRCESEHAGKKTTLFFEGFSSAEKALETLLKKKSAGVSFTLWESDPGEMIDQINSIISSEEYDLSDALRIMENYRSPGKKQVTLSDKFSYEDFQKTHCLPVVCSDDIREAGYYLTYGAEGDRTIYQRRIKARNNIASGDVAMRQLAAILEDVYEGCPQSRHRETIPPLTREVETEIFGKFSPTPTQQEAIRIALNTPDIAIIQGPPGTGKTTVITAIVRRLNEIAGNSDNIFGQTLVSAFQHDAVNNAIERMDNFGLPVIKIGEKRAISMSEKRAVGIAVENWIISQRKNVAEAHPEILKFRLDKEFSDKYRAYISSGSVAMAVSALGSAWDLLKQINECGTETGQYINNVLNRMQRLLTAGDEENRALIAELSRIPTTPVQYSDAGESIVRAAIVHLKVYGEQFSKMIEVLEIFVKSDEAQRDYATIKRLKHRLISNLKPKPAIFTKPQDNADVIKALNMVSELLEKYRSSEESPEMRVIADYYASLQTNYAYVNDSILAYSSISGATNQHSASRDIFAKKNNQYYDNVIVDEAARSNPLDLMIPMSLARDRIILVGDHRQLPHMLDECIAQKVETDVATANDDENIGTETEEMLKNSLFERLKGILTRLEQKDGIKRCITLDEQYRTHPLLGNFVSSTFYEAHDKSERFASPRGAEQFSHSLPGLENKAAVWMEVGYNTGVEERVDSSFCRRSEARMIVKHLKKMMDSEEGHSMTFGIITFYSGQVNSLCDALRLEGMAEGHGQSDFRIKDEYAYALVEKNGTKKRIERLRIGSVDAFQGMEFDVVYLSMVRCNDKGTFGFLRMENRLCVAMSRQKKILIAAGDSGMFTSDRAKIEVPSVYKFRQLCEEDKEYGAII